MKKQTKIKLSKVLNPLIYTHIDTKYNIIDSENMTQTIRKMS
jgi:hypothetical protein